MGSNANTIEAHRPMTRSSVEVMTSLCISQRARLHPFPCLIFIPQPMICFTWLLAFSAEVLNDT